MRTFSVLHPCIHAILYVFAPTQRGIFFTVAPCYSCYIPSCILCEPSNSRYSLSPIVLLNLNVIKASDLSFSKARINRWYMCCARYTALYSDTFLGGWVGIIEQRRGPRETNKRLISYFLFLPFFPDCRNRTSAGETCAGDENAYL